MKKLMLSLLLLAIVGTVAAQQYKITYVRSFNGKPVQKQDRILVFASPGLTYITSEANWKATNYPYEESYVDRGTKRYYQQTYFAPDNSIVTFDDNYQKEYSYKLTDETKEILGYKCKKAVTIVKSNTIELWYTNDLKVNGAPSDALRVQGAPSKIGQELGLVLEMVRNGNTFTAAQKVEKIKEWPLKGRLPNDAQAVDLLTYEHLLWKSRFVEVPVFNHDTLNFYGDKAPYVNSHAVLRASKGTVVSKKIRFPKIEQGARVFVDVTQFSSGDAYDRTGSIFIIPSTEVSFLKALRDNTTKNLPAEIWKGKEYRGVVLTKDFSPLVELMRFFTSFGVGGYNHYALKGRTWADSVLYRQDISDMANLLSEQEVWIGASIENYDKGGHTISANISIHPSTPLYGKLLTLPLINTLSIMTSVDQNYPTMFEEENGISMSFELPQDVKDARLRYISTGHGGWGGGDEFVPKLNTLYMDGQEVSRMVPWRSDCGSFRLYNPSSGNFSNGLTSSDLSRANWCPGSVTSPAYIPLGDLKAGKHTLRIKIPQGVPEGSSFSSWTVSAALLGELE